MHMYLNPCDAVESRMFISGMIINMRRKKNKRTENQCDIMKNLFLKFSQHEFWSDKTVKFYIMMWGLNCPIMYMSKSFWQYFYLVSQSFLIFQSRS